MSARTSWLIMLAACVVGTTAASNEPRTEILSRSSALIDADKARLVGVYKDLHQHPELAFTEVRTSSIVAKELRRLGFEVQTGIAKTGVVGILRNGLGPVVMYRADMDANAVKEASRFEYSSTGPVAHLCGHDAHVTWMLGMAKTLVAMKKDWAGTVVLIAQPAEELVQGAKAMVEDGLWTKHGVPKPDYYIGIHTIPFAVGTVVSSGGPKLAGTDQIDILFKGVGGHGSTPHLAKDPVMMAALAVSQFQSVIGPSIDPMKPSLISVGSIQAGTDNNVIPPTALVKASIRWFDVKTREQMIAGIRNVSESIARTYGLPEDQFPEITIKGGSTPLTNDMALASRLAASLKSRLGESSVITEFPAIMTSEDAHMVLGPNTDVPFAYLMVGVAKPAVFAAARAQGKLVPYMPHSPDFVVDLDAIPVGAVVATTSMLELLGRPAL